MNIQRYFPYDEEKNAERYEEFQRQRSMERDIKATKRECMMLQAAGDEEGLKQASQKLRQQKQKYNQFCNDKNLGTHYDRTQVYGYDRSKSAKTVWAERKAKGNANESSSFPTSSGTPFQTTVPQNKALGNNNQLVIDKPTAPNGEKQIFGILTNGSGSGIMKSRGYDFLDGVLGSNQISKEQSKSLDEIVSVIPKKHLSAIQSTVKKIEMVEGRGYCSYDSDSKTLILDSQKMNGSIVHEFGHVLADAYNVYGDTKFLNILKEKFDSLDWGDTLYTFRKEVNDYVYLLKSNKLLDTYQGRIYVDLIDIDYSQPIPLKCFQEYYSVGFDMYFKNPKLLQEKDAKLYDYLKEMLSDG